MPMDNNDNNYPALSEENSKITSVLHPYGLPKFDFDNTDIRFDNLSENEVFLGISSREDDNWIEDFSRGNSGIEFGSSTAECCSIPRHVDVWSEATSSESVEMLLKSVGQEEMLPGESIVEESDACDELGTLAKQMELNPRLDGNRNDQESNMEAQKVQPSDNSSGLKHGSEHADIEPKCSSLTQVEHSPSGFSVVHEWNSQDEESCDNENQPNPGTSLNESLKYNMEKTLFHGIQACSDISQHVREDVELLNGQARSSAKHLENASNEPMQKNACNVDDESDCRTHDAIHPSMSEFSVLAAPNADATPDFHQLSSITEKKESSLPPTKGNSQDLHSFEYCQNSEDLALPESLEIKHSLDTCEKSFGGPEVESSLPTTKGNSQDLHSFESCQNSEDLALPESSEIKNSTDIYEKSFLGSEGDPRVIESSFLTTEGNSLDLPSFESCQNSENLALPESLEIQHSTDLREKPFSGSEGNPRVKESSVPATEGNSQDLHSFESSQNFKDLALPESLEIQQSTDICEKPFGGSAGNPRVKESSLPTTKGNTQDIHSFESSQISKNLVLPESLEIKYSTDICEKSFGGSEGDLKVNEQAASSCGVDIECEQLNDFLSETSHRECSVESKESSQGSLSQLDKEVFAIASERQIPGTEPEVGIHIVEDPVNPVHDLPILADATQSAQSVTDHIAQNLEGPDGPTDNHEDTVLSSVPSGKVVSVEAANLGNQDPGEMSPKPVILYNDGARLLTLPLVDVVKKTICVKQSLESEKTFTMKSESNVASSDLIAASHGRSHGTTNETAEKNKELNLPSDVEPKDSHKTADTVADVILEEKTPSLNCPSQIKSETNTIFLAESSVVGNFLEEVIRDDSSLPLTETCDASPLNEGVMVRLEETLGFSRSMDVDSVPCDSNVVAADSAEDVAIVKHMETKLENSRQVKSSEVSGGGCFAEADQPSHNTASAIRCSKLPEPDERMKEDHIEPATENVSDSTSKASEVPSVPKNVEASEGFRGERSFSFDVPPVVEKESGSMPSGSQENHGGREAPKVACVVTEGGSASVGVKTTYQSKTRCCVEGWSASIGAKTTSGSKTRSGPAKSTKRKAKKGNNVTPEDNSSCGLVSQLGPARLLQFGVGITDSSGRKSTASPIPTSNLPDLNTSIPTSALFHQPFTDLQQLQLRAQIFVYGSLIQGTAPDEAVMVSAFGNSDGGRTTWEPKWRACVERLHIQKHVADNYSTPIQSRSGSIDQNKSSKQSARRSKAVPSSVNLFGNKGIPSVTVKPMIPLSSPLWNLSTPLGDGLPPSNVMKGGGPQALPPLHPCQTPPAQTFGGQSTSWLSPAPIPGPWVSSSRCSAFDLSAPISSSPSAGAVKLTSLGDSSRAITSSMKDSFNDHISDGGVSSDLVQDAAMQKITSSPAVSKSRKRRKSNKSEESSRNSLSTTSDIPDFDAVTNNPSMKGPDVAPFSSISSHPSTPLIEGHFSATVDGGVSSYLVHDPSMQKITSPPAGSKSRKRRKSNTTEESPQNSLSTTSDLPDSDAVTNNLSMKGPAVAHLSSISSHPSPPLIKDHCCTTVAETTSQVVALDQTQSRELHMENSSAHGGEIRQVEKAKLAGEEAVAHATDLVSLCQSVWNALEKQRSSGIAPDCELQLSSSAAAVAAAASVAKAAAAAAKLASTAALHFHEVAIQVLHGNAIPAQGSEYSMSDVANNLSDATPASILRGGNGNDAPNSIISAAKVAARRRVEAALAASQHAENLDAIVKAAELAAEAVSQAGRVVAMGKPMPLYDLVEPGPENCSTEIGDKKDIGSSKEACKQSEGPSDLEVATMVEGRSLQKNIVRDVSKNIEVDEAVYASHISGGTKKSPPDHAKAGSLASDHADAESVPLQVADGCGQKTFNDDSIKENCTVEVFKDGGWYSAKVLSLNDEKALVCFTDLQSDKESDSPREWIPLEGEGNQAPIIRVTQPISGVHFDGPRKRGRSASTDYQWSVGDRLDTWSKDCWREGVITEKNNNDPTTFTVHLPAHGESAVVKAWQLRPTLTWKNGKWIGLLTSRQSAASKGDTPRAKRLRLGSPLEVKGKEEILKTVDNLQFGTVDEPKLLSLSAMEMEFNVGSNRGDNKVEAPRMKRSGLQKEGLKFFGVPRPGKKQKFMDMSKHIVSERSTKNDVPNDSSKLSKYLIPPATGSRGFKNGSRADVKEKQFPESKLKAPNTGKLPGTSTRTMSQIENSTSAVSGSSEISSRRTVKGSISNNDRGFSNLIRSSSGSNHEAAISVPVSTQSLPRDRNKKASKNINSEWIMKEKLAAAGKAYDAAENKLLPDLTGPRRSIRKIQPTSRLLEGLQSSLITSKIPSYSYDRNHRLQSKGDSRGSNTHH